MNPDTRWPGNAADRKLTFGACTGNEMTNVRDNQLTDSPPVDYINFGKPQLAVVTLGGNDLDFETAINACIVRAHGYPFIPDCDSVLSDQLLTTQLRKRMNTIVNNFNFHIKRSVFRLEHEGVVYVEGFQDFYTDHQFCDPKADTNLAKPISPNTWFWASDSKEAFEAALDGLKGNPDPAIAAIPDSWRRIFHPKGTAYAKYSDKNLDTVLASRNGQAISDPAPPPPPLPPPAPDNICGSWYKVVLDYFEMKGKDFDRVKMGVDGEGLKKELQGCGKLTKWHWEYTPDDPNFEWFAKGPLPVGTKTCVERAVVSAGGEGPDGCTSSG
ncbi:MAG: hypothetical protein Q9164_004009 [Protoblastenia rupestris]